MQNSRLQEQIRVFTRNRTSLIGVIVLLVLIFMAVFVSWIAPHDPLKQNPYYTLRSPNAEFLLGTDFYGRDILSRMLWGARVSLAVGILSVMIGMVVGSLIGIIAALAGRRLGNLVMRAVDIFLCFPSEVFAILVLVILGQGLFKVILAIGLTMVPRFSRLSYGSTLSVKERDFIGASYAIGAKAPRIIAKHIVPNILGEILVISSLWTATSIRVEANLSFLGLGVAPPTPTWGNMVNLGVQHLTIAPWVSLFPGLAIMLAILAFNLIGDGMRDVLDPKMYN